ncbi:polynucleotide kinase 3 phosphatase-domain-containing protein [Boeremia exigua]|uniref:polynucleotide kinase 3 phosphatase-domain-containing protein n=1 Tax=Boeremia exigua TaxID=749465 RepID=UPI001E8D5DAD|nr:polynucleotide kinase 3 phosphatase-domain-containing protein [Boeremia exigua]KAH6639531.1 polynucleotide kinase 3 phosphatase-domain-containing protein [Boeremia exigua]
MSDSRKRSKANDKDVSPPAKRRQQSHTTNKAVASFFTPASKKEPEKMTWRIVKNSLLIGRQNTVTAVQASRSPRRRIAAFDFDSTLVTTASGKRFGRDASDWKWWHSSVPGKLRQLHEEGYLLAIISNQGGISLKPDPKTVKSDQKRLADFKSKVSAVFSQLDLPVSLYAATGRDEYRKPRVGMWRELLEDYDLEDVESVDLEESFFVGDAGGREAVSGTSVKDHSCVDRDFASNIGLPFQTPEEYFLHEPSQPFVRGFEPATFVNPPAESSTSANPIITKTDVPDIILLVGSPGAGKSSFYWKHLQPLGYIRVNQDILKTREKCVKAATALIDEGKHVVVDNTNADQDVRAVWVNLAKKYSMPIRCVLFTASAKLCEHNDTYRALNLGSETNPENRIMLPKLAFTSFASRYRAPMLEEGFGEIIKIDFEFTGSDAQKILWSKYWI